MNPYHMIKIGIDEPTIWDSQHGTNGQVYLEDVKSAVNLALVQQSWCPRFGGRQTSALELGHIPWISLYILTYIYIYIHIHPYI